MARHDDWNLPIDLDAERKALEAEHTDLRNEHRRLHVDPFDLDAHRKHRLKLSAYAARVQAFIVRLHRYNRQQQWQLLNKSDDLFEGRLGRVSQERGQRAEAADVKWRS